MQLDLLTLLCASGLVVMSAGTSFVISTLVRRDDRVARLWGFAFVSGILVTIAYAVWAASPSTWWIIGVGNGALVFAIGAMWSGARSFNGRRPLLWAVAAVVSVVVLAAELRGPDGGAWSGAAEMFFAITAFATAAGVETLRGRLRSLINGRILAVVFLGVALFYLVRTGVFLAAGETGEVFLVYFGTATTTLVNIVFITLAAIAMSVLQSERGDSRSAVPAADSTAIIGVLPRRLFDEQAREWLLRAEAARESLTLVVVEVDNLEHVTIALGSEYGDRAVTAVGMVTRDHVPTTSLVGAVSSRRFAVLTPTPPVGEPRQIGERILTALAEAPIDSSVGVRPSAAFGAVATDGAGYSYDELLPIAGRRASTHS